MKPSAVRMSTGLTALLITLATAASAQDPSSRTWLGDAGHFLQQTAPRILANNPDGKPFSGGDSRNYSDLMLQLDGEGRHG